MRGVAEGGTSGLENDQSACFVDDAIQFAGERGDVKELSLRKGNPAESREAFEALGRGMRPTKAKVRLLCGDMEWTFVLTAVSLDLSALKLPPTQSRDMQGRVADRLFLLEEGVAQPHPFLQPFLVRDSAHLGGSGGLLQGEGNGAEAPGAACVLTGEGGCGVRVPFRAG
jgi:hypothetical protein